MSEKNYTTEGKIDESTVQFKDIITYLKVIDTSSRRA
jgi:hypothetical protein